MATNRYRNLISVKSNYLPQEFIPDFNKYAQVLGNQQKLYDEAQALRDVTPKHLTVDAPDVQQYKAGINSTIDNLADIYNTQGVTAGNRQRKELLRQVRRDWQPGGKAYQFQQNYNAYQKYVENVDEMHKKGNISSDKRNALLSKSMEIFGKSFQDNVFKDFSGITPAQDVDLAKQADELAKGWAESKVRSGEYTIKGGQYFDMRTQEFVDANEIYRNVIDQLGADPQNSAYFNQAALLSGRDINEVALPALDSAARFAAEKYGYVKEDSQYLSNWLLREQVKLRGKKSLIDYENSLNAGTEETVAYTVNTGLPPLDISGEKIRMDDVEFDMTPITGGGGVAIGKSSQKTYAQVPLEKFANSEAGLKAYPGLSEMINMPQFQRQRGKEGDPNWVESDKDYNKRISDAWDSKRKALSVATGKYSQYNSKQKQEASAQVIGTKEKPGDIVHKTLWFATPGQPYKPVTYEQLLKATGNKTIEELNEHTNILGDLQSDNGIAPSGFQAAISKKNGKGVFNVIIGNTSIENSNYNKPMFDLLKPLHDGTMDDSGIVNWQPAENLPVQHLRARAVDTWNGQNFGGRDVIIYEINPKEGYTLRGSDADGNVLLQDEEGNYTNSKDAYEEVQSNVSPEDLIKANRNLNPYLPTRLNKQMENK